MSLSARLARALLGAAVLTSCARHEPPTPLASVEFEPATPDPSDPEEARALARDAAQAVRVDRLVEARSMLEELARRYPQSPSAQASADQLARRHLVGQPAPVLSGVADWLGDAPEGLDKGTHLLFFWELWCPPCREQAERLDTVADEAGIPVIGLTRLTRHATRSGLETFLEESQIGLPVGLDLQSRMTDAYVVSPIPDAVVVRDATVVWRGNPRRVTAEFLTHTLADAGKTP